MRFDLDSYDPVEDRLEKFWIDHPNGRVFTQLISDPGQLDECVVRAEVYFDLGEEWPRGTGLAFERRGGSGANREAHLENCETSALGRALASCGYRARKDSPRPSREEMRKVERGEARPAPVRPAPAPAPAPESRPAPDLASVKRDVMALYSEQGGDLKNPGSMRADFSVVLGRPFERWTELELPDWVTLRDGLKRRAAEAKGDLFEGDAGAVEAEESVIPGYARN